MDGIYSVLGYAQIINLSSNIFMKILLSIFMIYVAYNSKKVKNFFKQLLMFYLISFVFGGCALSLLYIVKPQEILIKNGMLIGTYPIKIAILGGMIGFIITAISFRIVKTKFTKKDIYCDIAIYIGEKNVKTKALLDTGNLLREPISGKPVVIVQKDILYNIIPNNILDNLENIILGNTDNNFYKEYITKFRVIPFTSLGTQNGLLLGIKVEKIKVFINDSTYELEDIIVGIYNNILSKKGNYFSLIGLDLIEGGKENEYNEIT